MKFQLAVNLERLDPSVDMQDAAQHNLEMVQMAETGGFSTVWSAEHHALEMTATPDPFQILTWWANHTNTIRLGTAVAVAAYWHPIKLAGTAAFTDLVSGGRLEFGIGSGAYQREFDRMAPGLKQSEGWRYMNEMIPVVRALWAGDYEHNGEFWSFPVSTSVPKPVQKEVPVWIAARAPITFDYAVKNNCNIMSWPLTRGMDEAEAYKGRLDEALSANPGCKKPTFVMMRHTAVHETPADREEAIRCVQRQLGQFENLFKNLGDVANGFPKPVDFTSLENRDEYDPDMLHNNLMYGTPDEVIAKLKLYEALGVDEFIFYASTGQGHADQKRSLKLFCDEVVPAFK